MEQANLLPFLQKILEKFRLNTHLLTLESLPEDALDLGLRKMLGLETESNLFLRDVLVSCQHNTIYRHTDRFFCSYLFLRLPDSSSFLLIGPYTTAPVTRQSLLEKAEGLLIPPWLLKQMERYYESVPMLSDTLPLMNIVSSFGEMLWGSGEAFRIETLDDDVKDAPVSLMQVRADSSILLDREMMETRYRFENHLMDIVSHGQVHRAELLLQNITEHLFESRVSDPVRNLKNYGIISNTLLRKAAEKGGVHPIYLDKTSSEFAAKIENTTSLISGVALISEMVRAYCRLVHKHNKKHYSPTVQKAVLLIETDLTQDLHLSALAKELTISPGYLSALFKEETQQTVTEYVTARRMELGKHLLTTTPMQVQTVAQYCGIPDVNYFSKLYKKHFGITPRESREQM